MGMSTHVVGIIPPDGKWKAMKAVYDACENAGIDIPSEVDMFFDGERPDPSGVVVDVPTSRYRDDTNDGYEIRLSDLNPNVKTLRFYNSW